MNNIGIYRLYWGEGKYFYIGQSDNLSYRKWKHLYKLRKGNHENKILQNVFNKTGITPIFEVVLHCDKNELNTEEQKLIDLHFNDPYCCNICPVAGSTSGYKHTAENLIKISEKSKLKVFTPEYRQKLSEAQIKRTSNRGAHKWSDEEKLRMSINRKGVSKKEDHKRKSGDAHRGAKSYMAKKVINVITGEFFLCVKDAAGSLGINYAALKWRLQHNSDPHWRYESNLLSTNEQ